MLGRVIVLVAATTGMFVASVPKASAQEGRAEISVGGGVIGGGDGSAPTLDVAGVLQMTRHAALELNFLYAPDQTFTSTFFGVPQIFPDQGAIGPRTIDGRTAAFLASFVARFERGRVRPFALFGGGLASVRYESELHEGVVPPVSTAGIRTVAASEESLAVTAGGGVDYLIAHRFAIGFSARYLRLLSESSYASDAAHFTRAGVSISYRF